MAVPTLCATPATDHVPVMADRFSVGLSFGGVGLTPKDATTATQFGIGELALRYRLGRHLELELSGGGGQQSRSDGTQGSLVVTEGVLAARWHFRPERHWNWYVTAGLGALTVADQNASDQERNDATRPMGEFGVGVERRWRHLAIEAELRGIGVGATKGSQDAMAAPAAKSGGGGTTTMAPPSGDLSNSDPSASGGEFTVGASYYF